MPTDAKIAAPCPMRGASDHDVALVFGEIPVYRCPELGVDEVIYRNRSVVSVGLPLADSGPPRLSRLG